MRLVGGLGACLVRAGEGSDPFGKKLVRAGG